MFKVRQLKRKKLLFIIIIALVLVLTAGFFGYKILTENEQVPSFGSKLTRFAIDLQNVNCTNSDEITGFLKGRNLNYFYFKTETLENDLKKKFLCIGQIEMSAVYPDKLKLKITGREGKFVVTSINATSDETNPQIVLSLDQMNATQSTTEAFPPKVLNKIINTYKQSLPSSDGKEASDSGIYLVDNDGVVFEQVSTDMGFPRLAIFSQDLKVGQTLPNDLVKKTAEVLEKLKSTDIPTDNLIIVGDRLIIDAKPRVTFSLDRAIDRQAASLQLILRQAKMNLDPRSGDIRSVDSIDLRFERPVVVYSKK